MAAERNSRTATGWNNLNASEPDIVCPVCGASVHWLSQRCAGCGAAVRDRVPALNLFSTYWSLFESPRDAFRMISRSEQKNYVFVLFSLGGPALVAAALLAARAGDSDLRFADMFALIAGAGPVVGILAGLLSAAMTSLLLPARIHRHVDGRMRRALLAYGLSPLAMVSTIVLPLQLALFGASLFSTDPWAFQFDPVPYWVLAALGAGGCAGSGAWTFIGFRLHGLSRIQALLVVIAVTAVYCTVLAGCAQAIQWFIY